MLRSFKYEPFSARIFITILYSIREHLTIEMTILSIERKFLFAIVSPETIRFTQISSGLASESMPDIRHFPHTTTVDLINQIRFR